MMHHTNNNIFPRKYFLIFIGKENHRMLSDSHFAKALKQGNAQAFESIYLKYADKIFRVSRSFYLEKEEAKEVVQDVFLTLWEKRHLINEDLSLNAFLLTIAKNKIINLQKKKAAELKRHGAYIERNTSVISAEDDYLFRELESLTLKFLDSLPDRRRQIFLMSRKEGLKNTEIAQGLNISLRTVENNIYQAEKEIRAYLKEHHLLIKSIVMAIGFFNC
ncbi:MAG TPA: RNA polymerase sigma-70 factor [Cyclobacteriaceae bacterium]|nr:RNA polymerase sigma-70 factor [Cyclobacteriaceae bacterium]